MNNYQVCLIKLFEYEHEKFHVLSDESNGLVPLFDKEKINSSGRRSFFNERGENILLEKDSSSQVVYKYKFNQNKRLKLGIMNKANYQYKVKNQDIFFEIVEIYVWFFKSGEAYLTLRIKLIDLDYKQVLKVNGQVNWEKFQFSYKRGRDGKEENMSIGELMKNCIACADKSLNIKPLGKTIYELECLLTDSLKNEELELSDFLERYRIGRNLESGSSISMDERLFYKPDAYKYISWGIAEHRLVMHGDCSKTSQSNITFMRNGLVKSIFSKYLLVYLYYINLLQRCTQIEEQQKKTNKNNNFDASVMSDSINLEKTIPEVIDLQYHSHINKLFCEYLCGKFMWNLEYRLHEVHSYDVFISYRHDGGQYLALLLYYMLKVNGIKVFLDNRSLRAGKFDDQLMDAIAQSKKLIAIISPGSIKRLQEEEDWVRKEISYAIKKGIVIIPVVMEKNDMPKKEELPQDIQGLSKEHGIVNSSVTLFDQVVKELVRLVKE